MPIKKILIYTNYLIHLDFFSRFKNSLEKLNYELFFITNKLSLIPISYKRGIKIKLITRTPLDDIEINIKNSVEILGNILTYDEGIKLYKSTYATAKEIINNYPIELIFIFGGTNIPEIAIQDLAQLYKIHTLFFELSNIPGKIFVDNKGTNAKSSLFKDINKLYDFHVSENEFIKWKRKYIEYKEKETMVPQAKQIKKINNIFLPLDSMGYSLLGVPFNKKERYIKKLTSKFNSSLYHMTFDKYNINSNNYIFLPLQVSTDSQILINSDYNNLQAIIKCSQFAMENNLTLLVKPHPADLQNEELDKVVELKNKFNFYLVNYNTFNLIRNSNLVVTINSTVGLESMILEKKVKFLGKSFYDKLSNDLLKNYILSYLVEIDFFSQSKILLEKTKLVLERIKTIKGNS